MGLYPFAAQTCQYSITMSLNSAQQAIRAALKQVVLEIPALQVGIGAADTNKPFFLRLPSLDLSNHLEWKDLSQSELNAYDNALVKALEEDHATDWQDVATKPSWKLVVFHRPSSNGKSGMVFEFLFEAHHSIADGRSLSVFHEHLASALNALSKNPGETEDLVNLPSSSVMTPPLEDLMSFDISKTYLFKALWGEFAPAWLQGKPAALPWTGEPISLSKRRINTRLVTIQAEAVSRLLETCRAHGTTITPLLNALIAASLSRQLPEQSTHGGLKGFTVIALRPFADKSKIPDSMDLKDSMGDMSTSLGHDFNPSMVSELRVICNDKPNDAQDTETLIWDLTKKMGGEIKGRLATLPQDDITGLLQWVSDWFKRAQEMEGKPRSDTWELSNLGTMPATAADAEWKLQRSVFSQSFSAFGPAISVNASTVINGPMTITVISGDGIVGSDLLDGLAEDLGRWLNNIVTGKFGIAAA